MVADYSFSKSEHPTKHQILKAAQQELQRYDLERDEESNRDEPLPRSLYLSLFILLCILIAALLLRTP